MLILGKEKKYTQHGFKIRGPVDLKFLRSYLEGISPEHEDMMTITNGANAIVVDELPGYDRFGVYFQKLNGKQELEESLGNAFFPKREYYRLLSNLRSSLESMDPVIKNPDK